MANQGLTSSLMGGGLTELRKRVLFVLLGILIFRIGAHLPVPGLDPERLAELFNQQQSTIIGLANLFSGGALSRLTIFAIGIMPYITASIIIQLFTSVSPKLSELKKEGEAGRRKINQYTRYGTFGLAVFQSLGMSMYLASQGIALNPDFGFYFTATVTLTTGTMFLMWLGEQMTERGVGNGISIIIFTGIIANFPTAIGQLLEQARTGQMQAFALIILTGLVILVIGFVVFVERAQRKIKVNYAQRTQGRKVYAAHSSHLPLKINMAGVIPAIFATSIILTPASLAQWFGRGDHWQWIGDIGLALSPGQPLYLTFYALAIIFFAFFYTALVFNPKETADNLKRSGAFVPGIRPGEKTANYVDSVMTRLTLVGALYLVLVCMLPEMLMYTWNVPFYFGGTSLLIVVVVIMDFMAQIQSHIMSHQYESFIKKAQSKGGGSKFPGWP